MPLIMEPIRPDIMPPPVAMPLIMEPIRPDIMPPPPAAGAAAGGAAGGGAAAGAGAGARAGAAAGAAAGGALLPCEGGGAAREPTDGPEDRPPPPRGMSSQKIS